MTEIRTKNRAEAMLAKSSGDRDTGALAVIGAKSVTQAEALQVLALAQKTAEEHVGAASRYAERVRADAQAAADQLGRDAQVYAHNIKAEADKLLGRARSISELAAKEARAQAEKADRHGTEVEARARVEAEKIVEQAGQRAEELKVQAQLRYEDAVGGLRAKREALQQQIEALERFDNEYRSRLGAFMQAQLRALWSGEPEVGSELEPEWPPKQGSPTRRPTAAAAAKPVEQRNRPARKTERPAKLSD